MRGVSIIHITYAKPEIGNLRICRCAINMAKDATQLKREISKSLNKKNVDLFLNLDYYEMSVWDFYL
jgi:hypothetical protein